MQSNTFLSAHRVGFFLHNFLILTETGDQELQRKKLFGIKFQRTIP